MRLKSGKCIFLTPSPSSARNAEMLIGLMKQLVPSAAPTPTCGMESQNLRRHPLSRLFSGARLGKEADLCDD